MENKKEQKIIEKPQNSLFLKNDKEGWEMSLNSFDSMEKLLNLAYSIKIYFFKKSDEAQPSGVG